MVVSPPLPHRGVVLAASHGGGSFSCDVRLVDTGQLRRLDDLSRLRRLPAGMAGRNAFCHCVRLHGVKPAASPDGVTWPASAMEAFRETVKELPHVFLAIKVRKRVRKAFGCC